MKYISIYLQLAVIAMVLFVPAQAQIITTYATSPRFQLTTGIAMDHAWNLLIADENVGLFKVSPGGIITQIAGNGSYGFSGDGGPATAAALRDPMGVAVDGSGNIYIADMGNERIRKIDPSGIISTFAGIGGIVGVGGFSGDGGPATNAQFSQPSGVALDALGNVYIADANNGRVRMINTSGIINTIAGGGTSTADGIPATSAYIDELGSVAIDGSGNIYLANFWGNKIMKVNTAGIITTIAGTGSAGYNGDNITAITAQLNMPDGVAVDTRGNVYIADESNRRVRKVDSVGIISTIAGTGVSGYTGDGGLATLAELYWPYGIVIASNGNVFVSDHGGKCVRMIDYGAHGPFFTGGHNQIVNICSDGIYMDTFLVISDIDTGNTITWSLVSGPLYGTVHIAYSSVSTGGTITPTGLTYLRDTAYSGNDTFKVRATDGTLSDTITIYIECDSTEIVNQIQKTRSDVTELFPNPTSGTFLLRINSEFNEDVQIIINSILGEKIKTIKTTTNKQTVIQIDALPGIYFLNSITEHGSCFKQFMIKR